MTAYKEMYGIVLAIIIIFSISISIGGSTDEPIISEEIRSSSDVPPEKLYERMINERITISTGGGRDGGSSGGGSSEKVYYRSYSDDLIFIRKLISPASKEGYLLGEPLLILVDVKNIKLSEANWDLTDIYLREIIDDEFSVVNITGTPIGYRKLKEIDEICCCINELYRCNQKISMTYNSGNNITPYIKTFDTYIFNLDNISENVSDNGHSNDCQNLLTLLREDYGIQWTGAENSHTSVSKCQNTTIYINSTLNCDDRVVLRVDEKNNNVIINICNDDRSYELGINGTNESGRLIYDKNAILGINLTKLKPDERVIYWYYVKPKKPGIFNTETIVKMYDGEYLRNFTVEYPLDIEINKPTPEFDVNLRLRTSQIYRDDVLKVYYDVTYLGGAKEPNCENIIIELDKPENDYCLYVDENGSTNSSQANRSSFKEYSSLKKYETVQILRYIKYPATGTFSIPGIWINNKHYTFKDEEIIVDTPIRRHIELIGLFVALVGIIIGQIYGKCILKHTTRYRLMIATALIPVLIIIIYSCW